MTRKSLIGLFVCVWLCANVAAASDVTFLTAQNRPFPGTNPPFAPTNYANSTISSNGVGFALSGTGSGGISFVWGNPAGASPAGAGFYLFGTDFTPSTTLLGTTALSGQGNVLNAASNGQRLFVNTTTIGQTGQAVPSALLAAAGVSSASYGDLFSTLAYAGNRPLYRATIRENGAAANTDHLMVRGLPDGSPEILVRNSQLFPGAPAPTPTAAAIGVTRRAYFPNSTSHARGNDNWMTKIYLERDATITSSNDQLLVLNGAALTVGGDPVQLRTQINAPWKRDNEQWNALNNTAVSARGDWMFTGQGFQLGTAGSQQQLLVRNGDLVYRESDVVDFNGVPIRLGNNLGQVAMNDHGDWAVPWIAQRLDTGTAVDVLLFNGEVIVASGMTTYELDGSTRTMGFLHMADGRVAVSERSGGFVNIFFGGISEGQNAFFVVSHAIPEPTSAILLGIAAGALLLRRRRES